MVAVVVELVDGKDKLVGATNVLSRFYPSVPQCGALPLALSLIAAGYLAATVLVMRYLGRAAR